MNVIMTGPTQDDNSNMASAASLPVKCGACDELVVDGKQASISCDICEKWFHVRKSCSVKKTVFNAIDKDFQWACKNCIKKQQVISSVPYDVLKYELQEQQKVNQKLLDQVKQLNELLNLKEVEIINLTDQLNSRPEMVLDGDWGRIGKNRPRPRSNTIVQTVGEPSVTTQNSFQVLSGEDSECDSDEMCEGGESEQGTRKNKKPRPRGGGKGKTRLKNSIKNHGLKSNLFFEADSNGRGMSHLISQNSNQLSVRATVRPGAPMRVVVQGANNTLKCLNEASDSLVVMGGLNDLTDQGIEESVKETAKLLQEAKKLGRSNQIYLVETPYRYDNLKLNHQIKKQNELLKEVSQNSKCPFIHINTFLYRMHYTKHGLHLNPSGKKIVSSIIQTVIEHRSFLRAKPNPGMIG